MPRWPQPAGDINAHTVSIADSPDPANDNDQPNSVKSTSGPNNDNPNTKKWDSINRAPPTSLCTVWSEPIGEVDAHTGSNKDKP